MSGWRPGDRVVTRRVLAGVDTFEHPPGAQGCVHEVADDATLLVCIDSRDCARRMVRAAAVDLVRQPQLDINTQVRTRRLVSKNRGPLRRGVAIETGTVGVVADYDNNSNTFVVYFKDAALAVRVAASKVQPVHPQPLALAGEVGGACGCSCACSPATSVATGDACTEDWASSAGDVRQETSSGESSAPEDDDDDGGRSTDSDDLAAASPWSARRRRPQFSSLKGSPRSRSYCVDGHEVCRPRVSVTFESDSNPARAPHACGYDLRAPCRGSLGDVPSTLPPQLVLRRSSGGWLCAPTLRQ